MWEMYQSPKYDLSVAKCIQVQLSKSKKSEDEMLSPKTGQNLKCFEGGGKKGKRGNNVLQSLHQNYNFYCSTCLENGIWKEQKWQNWRRQNTDLTPVCFVKSKCNFAEKNNS